MTYPGVDLKFVSAYGFQHIQNVIRKLKTQKCDYEYIELMACPSGCLNGGGQIKAPDKDMAAHLEAVSAHNSDISVRQLKVETAQIDNLLQNITKQYSGWDACEFHPIDESDPMF